MILNLKKFSWGDLIFKRVAVLYALTLLFFFCFLDLGQTIHLAKLRTLNRLRPEYFHYLIDLSEKRASLDHEQIDAYEHYFRRLTQYLPNRADAYGMHGFCLYHLGNYPDAIKAYKKALQFNPTFFWFYQNLGIIYFKIGQFEKSQEMFKDALMMTPENAILFISISEKIYRPILAEHQKDLNVVIKDQLKEGAFESYVMLVLSNERMKEYQDMLGASTVAIRAGMDRDGIFYFYSGYAAYQLKKYQEAVLLLQQAIDRNSNNYEANVYLGLCLQALGQTEIGGKFLFKGELLKKPNTSLLSFDQRITLGLY